MKKIFIILSIILTFSSYAFASTSKSAGKDLEHAFSVGFKIVKSYSDYILTKKGGPSVQSDDYDVDGRNSAFFVSSGAKITLKGSSTITTTNANHSHGVFAYTNDANTTRINLNATVIKINSDYSAGLMTGGGIISADSVTVTTSGDSSPAIRINDNGGEMLINGGTFTTKGPYSPAVMLNSNSELTISNSTLTASHVSSDIVAVNNDSEAVLNLSKTNLSGTLSVDEDSELTLNLKDKSKFTGKIKTSGDVNIYVELGSTWSMTGDSYVNSLNNEGKIISNDYILYIIDSDGNIESEDTIIHEDPVEPTITTASLKSGAVGKLYSVDIKAKGTTPIYWEKTSGTLPDGLDLDYDEDNGFVTLSGTPTKMSTYTFMIKASNDVGTSLKTFTVKIAATPTGPTITTTSLTNATIGKSYSFTLNAKGTTPITWSADKLPAGMNLTSAGILKGKPTETGSTDITFTATNTEDSDSVNLDFVVKGVVPSISGTVSNGTIGKEYLTEFTIKGSDSPDVTLSGDIPSGLSFESSGDVYVLKGTPLEAWNKTFTIKASSKWGEASKIYSLVITAVKPKFVTSSLVTGDISEVYSCDIKIEGTSPDITVTGLPAGIESSDIDGGIHLEGTPTESGTFTVKIIAKNSAGSTSKSYKLIIYAPPEITTISHDVTVNANFSFTLKATGSTPITWTATDLDGLRLTTKGVLSGKLTSTGSKTISITATNSVDSDTKTFTLTAKNPAPGLTGTVKQGAIDMEYSATFKATGNGDISLKCDSTLPAGLSFVDNDDKTASITGTPTEAFNQRISVTAMTSDGVTTTKIFSLVIKATKPQITTKALNTGIINQSYSSDIEVTGTKTITTTVTGLPDGLSYNDGTIEGTPTKFGKFTVKISASNSAGTATKSLRLEIYSPPVINANNITANAATTGKSYSKKFTATGTTPIKWIISDRGTLPSEFKLSSSGTLSGKTNSFGSFDFTVTASNIAGSTDITISNFSVNSVAPKITTSSLKRGTEDKDYGTFTLRATGTAPITWEADNLPGGLDLDSTAGTITGTPTEAGTFKVKLTATNAANTSVSKTVNLIISAAKKSTKATPDSISLTDKRNSDSTSLSANESEQINEEIIYKASNGKIIDDYIIIAELGTISADSDGMYDFDVVLSEDAEIDAELMWIANAQDVEYSEDDEICEFYDSDGEEIDSVPEDKFVTISVWLEEGIIYKPVIAVKKE